MEVRAVQEACRALEADYAPLITFVTVQKRHHVRLFAENPREQVQRLSDIFIVVSGNLPSILKLVDGAK